MAKDTILIEKQRTENNRDVDQELPKVKDTGVFAPERGGIDKGVLGGLTMMAIAVIWFVVGYAAGIIFFYPPILLLIGVYACLKGILTGNVCGRSDSSEQL